MTRHINIEQYIKKITPKTKLEALCVFIFTCILYKNTAMSETNMKSVFKYGIGNWTDETDKVNNMFPNIFLYGLYHYGIVHLCSNLFNVYILTYDQGILVLVYTYLMSILCGIVYNVCNIAEIPTIGLSFGIYGYIGVILFYNQFDSADYTRNFIPLLILLVTEIGLAWLFQYIYSDSNVKVGTTGHIMSIIVGLCLCGIINIFKYIRVVSNMSTDDSTDKIQNCIGACCEILVAILLCCPFYWLSKIPSSDIMYFIKNITKYIK